MLSKSAEEKILSQWDQIKDAFANSITGMFPISGRKNTLELVNLFYDDSKTKDADIKSQQLAKEQEKTWGVPVFAEFVLKDKETGTVINKSKQKIAVLPKMTQRFTYIIGGGEYNSAYQQRIKSGIYSKINEKGEHLTEINLNGRNNAFVKEARLKIPFDLETKKFKFNYATNNIPLYSFLKCVGVSDDEMKKEWGEDVWKANHTTKWKDDIKKMYEKKWKGRGLKVEGDSFEHLQTAVTEALSKSAVLPETTKLTIGRPVEKLSGKEILEASTHLLKTARGERAPDDQASMVFKQLLGLDDFIAEKFNSPKTGLALKLKIRNNVDRKDKISSIVSSDLFNRPLSQVFYSNALSQRPDQTNPLDILASKSLVTSMGPGGITSEHQLRPSMKMVNQTHFGVIDPIMTPEGETTGISLHLPIGVRKIGREAKVYVYDTYEKKYVYKNPAEIHGDWLGSPDYFTWKGGQPVTTKDKVMAMSPDNHDFMEVDSKKVRYIIPSSRNLFTEATNAIPFLQCNQGNRTMTGSRQPSQGVSLLNREAPLVQVKSNSKDSFEKVFGSTFSHASPEEGKVTHIVKDDLGNAEEIHITDKTGNTHKVQIYNHFPLNEKKTFIHSEPIVKIGDTVSKGQTIADSNYTRNGVMSTGVNMHTGYVNYKSLTFEDSVVISESAAKKLSSIHMHRPTIETGPEDVVSLNKFLAYASSAGKKIKKDRLDNLDKEGVIKPGTRVKPGDILVAAVGKNELPEDFAKLGARLKGAILPYRDKSLVWDSEHEGEVVKVVKKPGETGYTVHVKTVEPMKVGDKLCYDEETEVLTKTGWKFIKDVQLDDEICTLNPTTHQVEYQNPSILHWYPELEGEDMYKIENDRIDLLVTLDHKMYVRDSSEQYFSLRAAKEINKPVYYLTQTEEILVDSHTIIPFNGSVFCVTVPNHVIYVRRNGKPVWSGNSARHGDKNIVGAILPDEHMPRVGGPNGKPLEMLTSPTGTPSRINLGQALELCASKIANKTGTPYITSNFQPGIDYAEKLRKELKEHGLKDKEVIYDPLLKVELENPVLTGHKYVLKLKHQVEKKESVRGMDQSLARKYSINEDPSRGGGEGAQAIAQLDMYALLAHGARANLREMTSYKAERQHNSETMADTDFWNRVMLGLPLQPPKATFAYNKFEGMLQGMGLNLKKDGYDTVLTPLTDKGVLHLSAGEITNSKMLRGKDDLEIKGGLFDKKITGGATGKGWSHIQLAEPFPNPLFVGTKAQPGPAVVLSGLKYEDFEKVVRGEHTITVGGKDLTGGKAISEVLKRVDVNKEFEKTKNELKNLSGTFLDKANKKAKFLRALKNLNMKADEAYIMNHLPVIPPAFRPVVPMSDGSIASADINTLYAHIIQDNAALKDKTTLQYNPELHKKLNASVYDKLKAAIGIGSVPTYEGNKELKGLAKTIAGDNPKSGFFQNKIMKRRQDLSMRSTITPAADLQLDQVAIPKDSAMELYKPFVIRTLIQSGKDLIEATKEVKEQTPMAWKALEHTIKERPVLIKRDPVLHKYNMQAYYPVLKEGKSIGLHPLACGAFNADFDGNCIIGDVNISLKLWYNYSGEDTSVLKKTLEEKYQMKFTGTTKLVAVDNDGVMVEMQIKDMPRIEESLSYDKNGASVYAVPPGIFVWSYDHQKNIPTYEPVTHLTVEERCDVAKVNTRRFEVTASTNESLCVYDHESEQLVDICPKDSIGRLSPVMKKLPVTGTIDDYELGWFIGAFLSDGAVPGTTIMYTKASQLHRDRFFAALQKLQTSKVNRRTYEEIHGPMEEISGISVKDHYTNIEEKTLKLLQDCYEKNEQGFVPSGVRSALYKKMPIIACQFSENTLIGLFAGLIDGDGSISINNSKAKPQVIANFSTSSPYLRDGVSFLCRLLGIRSSVSETLPKAGRVQKHINYVVSFSTVDLQKLAPRLLLIKEESVNALNLLISQELKDDGDLVPVPTRIMNYITSSAGPLKEDPIFSSLRTIKSSRKAGYYLTRNLAKYILSFIKAANILNVDLWEKLVNAENVVWDTIVSVENLGKTTVYDLAIPTTKVFAVNGGLVIYDTMAVYLPLTEEARKEAIDRMLPSKNLFSTTNYGIMHAPDQEAVIGIHLSSTWGAKKNKLYNSLQDIINDKSLHRSDVVRYKLLGGGEKETTKGRATLASFLPSEYPKDKLDTLLHDSSFSFKKGTIHSYLETAARLDRKKYPEVVDGWRNLGNETAYKAGFSYSIHDLKPNKELRESILKPYHAAAEKIKATSVPQEEKDQKVIEIYSKATKELEDAFTKYYREQNNNMHKMIDIKARGNFGQFRQMVVAPMLMADNKGVIPTPITKSFSEGLSIPEYWNTLYGARMGTLSRAQGTSVPGAMAKELSNISVSTTVSAPDCGVSKGHHIPVISHDGKEEIDITDRYLAKDIDHPQLKIKANTLITSDLFAKIKQAGIQKVEVRSPLTCKDSVGICQKCMGLNSEGHIHDIGTNVGIIASQALSEPAIQIAMDSFHSGGIATGRGVQSVSALQRAQQLFNLPKTLPNSAVLSKSTGIISKIEKDSSTNGHYVFVKTDKDEHKHYVPPSRDLLVKSGDSISRGDSLSDGVVNPRQLLQHKNMDEVRNYITDQLHRIYKNVGGTRRRNVEVVVRNLTNLTEVADPGKSEHLTGDVVPLNIIQDFNSKVGTEDKILHKPILKGIKETALLKDEDYLSRMNFQRIQNTLIEGAGKGWKTTTKNTTNPIPAFAASTIGPQVDKTKPHY